MASVNCRVRYKSEKRFKICRAKERKLDQGEAEYASAEKSRVGGERKLEKRREKQRDQSRVQ